MPESNPLRVLDAARLVVDDINRWLDKKGSRVPDAAQLREAAGSITSNIREAYGRQIGPDRNKFLRYAHGSSEETDERLRTAYAAKHASESFYWKQHNRLVVISRMLTALMERSETGVRKARPRKPRRKRRKRRRQ